MGLSSDELRQAVARYATTVNGRDPAAIAALFTENGVQSDPASRPPNIGQAAIARFFADGIAASDAWTFEASNLHTCASTVAFEFGIAVRMGEGRMLISGIEVFVFAEDGHIASAHAYWDDADVSFA